MAICLVTVLTAGGQAAPGAFVSVIEASRTVPEVARVTNTDGVVKMALPAGEYRLEARHPSDGVGRVWVVVGGLDDDGEADDGRAPAAPCTATIRLAPAP